MLGKATTLSRYLLIFIVIAAALIYFCLTNLSAFFTPPITLEMTLAAPGCDSAQLKQEHLFQLKTPAVVTGSQPLSPDFQSYSFTISPTTKSVTLTFCDASQVTLNQVRFLFRGQAINLSLTDSRYLLCLGCIAQTNPDNSLTLIPNPQKVSLQVINIEDYVSLFFRNALTLVYRLPHLALAAFFLLLALSAFPLTATRLEFMVYAFGWLLFFKFNWASLKDFFPPAGYSDSQILAAVQFMAIPLRADLHLTLLLLCLITLTGFALRWRNRRLKPLRPSLLLRLGLLFLFYICLYSISRYWLDFSFL